MLVLFVASCLDPQSFDWKRHVLEVLKEAVSCEVWQSREAEFRSWNAASHAPTHYPARGPNHHHPNSGMAIHSTRGTFKSSQGQWQGRHQKQGQFPWEPSESFRNDQCLFNFEHDSGMKNNRCKSCFVYDIVFNAIILNDSIILSH